MMMKKSLLITLVLANLMSGRLQATNYPSGNVSFTGEIMVSTCNFMLGASNPIVFSPLAPGDFGGINQGPWQGFDISFGNCPPNVTSLDLMFSGTADANNPQAFANSTTSGSATGVAVYLGSGNGVSGIPFTPNQPTTNSPITIDPLSGWGAMGVFAQLIQTTIAEPTPGTVTAYATVNVVY